MKIKILKDEYIFSKIGLHVCDENGFAIRAKEDTTCDVLKEHADRVKEILALERSNRGLDADGNAIIATPAQEEQPIALNSPDQNNNISDTSI